jgi:glycine C-acetyltransferase
MYIYSNPITAGEARAALRALEMVDSSEGRRLLALMKLSRMDWSTSGSRLSPASARWSADDSRHRQDARDGALPVREWRDGTGLAYPVVPRADEEIRAHVLADHTQTS